LFHHCADYSPFLFGPKLPRRLFLHGTAPEITFFLSGGTKIPLSTSTGVLGANASGVDLEPAKATEKQNRKANGKAKPKGPTARNQTHKRTRRTSEAGDLKLPRHRAEADLPPRLFALRR
jgi:hypothetical protein